MKTRKQIVSDTDTWRLAVDVAQGVPTVKMVAETLRAYRTQHGVKALKGGSGVAKVILERARHIRQVREERADIRVNTGALPMPVIDRWPVQRHDRTLHDRVWYGKVRRAMDALPQEDFR